MYSLIILGLDSLCYDLIENWGFKNLQQKTHNRIIVPLSKITKVPNSVQVWSSFLTGEITNLDTFDRERKFLPFFKIVEKVRKKVPISLGLSSKIFKPKGPSRFPKLEQNTFLDNPNVGYYNAPFFDFDNKSFNLLHEAKYGKGKIVSTKKEIEKLLKYRLNEISLQIQKNTSTIFFAYMHELDALQHLTLSPKKMFHIYRNLDLFIKKINDQTNDKIIIVSDHGYDFINGTHSKTGFFSANYEITPVPKKITDFYKIVKLMIC